MRESSKAFAVVTVGGGSRKERVLILLANRDIVCLLLNQPTSACIHTGKIQAHKTCPNILTVVIVSACHESLTVALISCISYISYISFIIYIIYHIYLSIYVSHIHFLCAKLNSSLLFCLRYYFMSSFHLSLLGNKMLWFLFLHQK